MTTTGRHKTTKKESPKKRVVRIRSPKVVISDHERFLAALRKTSIVLQACDDAGVSHATMYLDRKADEQFAAAWDEAEIQGVDSLEREANRRAVEGVKRPVYQGGHKVGEITEYSDVLLIFMMKNKHKKKYGDKSTHEFTGPAGRDFFELIAASLDKAYGNNDTGTEGSAAPGV